MLIKTVLCLFLLKLTTTSKIPNRLPETFILTMGSSRRGLGDLNNFFFNFPFFFKLEYILLKIKKGVLRVFQVFQSYNLIQWDNMSLFYHKIPLEELYYLEPLDCTVVHGNMYLELAEQCTAYILSLRQQAWYN